MLFVKLLENDINYVLSLPVLVSYYITSTGIHMILPLHSYKIITSSQEVTVQP